MRRRTGLHGRDVRRLFRQNVQILRCAALISRSAWTLAFLEVRPERVRQSVAGSKFHGRTLLGSQGELMSFESVGRLRT